MTTNNKIDLNTCVPGQKVKLRDETIVTYNGLINENRIYKHEVDGYSYTDNGNFWEDDGRISTKDVMEILPMENSKPEIDLNTCVPGQKVKLRNGKIAIYKKSWPGKLYDYPHSIDDRSYTDDGKYVIGVSNHIYDVIEILPLEKESKPVTDLRTCVPGQKVRLRYGAIDTYKRATDCNGYPHRLCSGRTYTDEGYYWLDKARSDNDVMEIFPLEYDYKISEEEPAKTSTELTHSITDQIDVTSPDHVSIIPHENGVTISIKKGLTTISWKHSNS